MRRCGVAAMPRELLARLNAVGLVVDDGYSLVIYPEGGRSPDGWGCR